MTVETPPEVLDSQYVTDSKKSPLWDAREPEKVHLLPAKSSTPGPEVTCELSASGLEPNKGRSGIYVHFYIWKTPKSATECFELEHKPVSANAWIPFSRSQNLSGRTYTCLLRQSNGTERQETHGVFHTSSFKQGF